MRVGRVAAAVLVVVVFACFGGSAAAAAKGRAPERWLDMYLQGSDGYSVHISSGPSGHLNLKVSKGWFSATYVTRDQLPAPDRVKAQLRGMGTVSVRFHPRGPVRQPMTPYCSKRQRPTLQPGLVRGTIRFSGERDYFQVEADEAKASMEVPKKWNCRYAEKDVEFDPSERDWVSKFTATGDGVFFLARRYQPGALPTGDALYFTETGELFKKTPDLPWLLIWREIKVPAPASTFQDAHPEHLTISPPPPFSGTGSLVRTPESVFTWRGDLALQFPGLDPIPLAGSTFEPGYCLREWGCIDQHLD